MEDADFLQKLRSGDKAAFNSLVLLHSKIVLNTCYRFLLNRKDAEDISQEVFIEVFQSIRSFRGESKFSTWIYRIAVTKSLDEIKKQKRKKRIAAIGKILHLEDVAGWIAGGTLSDKAIIEEEHMKDVLQVLNKLPDNQRIAFTLSKIDGYSNIEISDIMGTTTIAVESLISHAKKRVSTELRQILRG
jgi:RNA polymerase sigma-70 factor (ECF subfamily)